MSKPWMQEEIDLLREHYPNKTCAEISVILKRSRSAITAKAGELGFKSDRLKMIQRHFSNNVSKYYSRNRICTTCKQKFFTHNTSRLRCFSCSPKITKSERSTITLSDRYPDGQKQCSKCKRRLPLNQFRKCKKRYNNTLESKCRNCNKIIGTEKKRQCKSLAVKYKNDICMDCKQKFPDCVFDFHHRDPTQKDYLISSRSLIKLSDTIIKELDKCDLLCSNCHRIRHSEINNH